MDNDNKNLNIQNQSKVINQKEVESYEKQKESKDMLEAGREALFRNLEKIRENQQKNKK